MYKMAYALRPTTMVSYPEGIFRIITTLKYLLLHTSHFGHRKHLSEKSFYSGLFLPSPILATHYDNAVKFRTNTSQ